MPTISIIVPVYNVENYICNCIDSVLSQTFNEFECILVNDGSSDNCGKICDKYAKKDSRIIVIHQENAGVSAARNAGLDIAKGKWIGFVDGDDWCEPDMFKILYENAVKYKCDVSICGYRSVTIDNKIRKSSINCNCKLHILNKEKAIIGIFLQGYFGGFSWNKLVKSDIFVQNKLRYDTKIRYMQDVLFFYELFKCIKKAVYFPMPYYNYIQHSESTTNQYGLTEKAKTALSALDRIISLESCLKIKNKVILEKVSFAYNLCKHYIIRDDYINHNFLFLRKIILSNIRHFLFDFSIPLKRKILYFLIFFPYLYRRFYYITNNDS